MLVCIWIDITFLPQPNFVFLYMLDLFFSIPLHLKIVYKNCVMCIHFSMISVILSFSAHSWLFYGATHSHNGQFPNQRNMLDRGFRQSSLISKTHTLYIQNTLGRCTSFLVSHWTILICQPIGGYITLSTYTYHSSPLFKTLSTGLM